MRSQARLSRVDRFRALCFRLSRRRRIMGFEVGVLLGTKAERERGFRCVADALALIAAHDPRRFRRLHEDLNRIWIGATHNRAEYIRGLDMCVLEFGATTAPETSPAEVALLIVHEATHARLERAGIRYLEPVRRRIEQTCIRAERDVARRIPGAAALEADAEDRLARAADQWTDAAFREREAAAVERLGLSAKIGTWIGRLLLRAPGGAV